MISEAETYEDGELRQFIGDRIEYPADVADHSETAGYKAVYYVGAAGQKKYAERDPDIDVVFRIIETVEPDEERDHRDPQK